MKFVADAGIARDFGQGALVQETINAFERSFRTRAWCDFPLEAPAAAGEPNASDAERVA